MSQKIIFKYGNESDIPAAKEAGQVLFAVKPDGTGNIYFDKDNSTRIKMGLFGGGTINGTLLFQNAKKEGHLKLYGSDEGGNIQIQGPNNKYYWEMDAFHDNQLRLYCYDINKNEIYGYWGLNSDLSTLFPGKIQAPRAHFTSSNDALETANKDVALRLGAENGAHLDLDDNEIIAKNDAATMGTLHLQGLKITEGGNIITGAWNGSVITTAKGGTGQDMSAAPANSLIRMSSAGTFWYTASANGAVYATSANGGITFGTLPVAQGGTGKTTFTSGQALIGNGTGAIATRAITNNTAKGPLISSTTWTNSSNLVTLNTLAYWDGARAGDFSNLSKLGTVTKGTWNASTIAVAYGGTGSTTKDGACENLGAVKKSGDTMTGSLKVANSLQVYGDAWRSIGFETADGKDRASMMISDANVIHFNVRTTGATYADRYKLPSPTANKTAESWYDILTTKNTVTVAQGGTGATTFTSGQALIGNGTGAITTRAITNNTTTGPLNASGWGSTQTYATALPTMNTLAYWDGAYAGNNSNLTKLGTITKGVWNSTIITTAYGGTGQDLSAAPANAIVRSSSAGTLWYTASANGAVYATSANGAITFGTLPVAQGGTGKTTFTSGQALIGNGTSGITTRAITDNTAVGALISSSSWTSNNSNLVTLNTLAFWNGAHAGNYSNLTKLGTVTIGTWQATKIGIAYGGTNAANANDARKNLAAFGLISGITSTADDTVAKWCAKLNGYAFYSTAGQINGQPNQWGFLLNYVNGTTEAFQIWHTQPGGATYWRSGNGSGWATSWTKVYDELNKPTASELGVLPLAGGTMTGTITLAATGLKTSHGAGFTTNQYGNFIHQGTSTTDVWCICNNAGTSKFSVQYETGAVTAQSITASTASFTSGADASETANNSVCIRTGSATGQHLDIDNNEIISKTDAATMGDLYLQGMRIAASGKITSGTWNASAIGIGYGGTGATSASGACTNLGAVKKSGDAMTGQLSISHNSFHTLKLIASSSNTSKEASIGFFQGTTETWTMGVATGSNGTTDFGLYASNRGLVYKIGLDGDFYTYRMITGKTMANSWIKFSHEAPFRINAVNTGAGAAPVLSAKTPSGAWGIGSYNTERLYFVYGSDDNYNSNTNQTKQISFDEAGKIYADVYSGNGIRYGTSQPSGGVAGQIWLKPI